MNPNQIAARQSIEQSQQALERGEKHLARQYAEQAARLAPELEEVWLMLALLASPQASMAFLQKALEIAPHSERAQKGMRWAEKRLRKPSPPPARVKKNPGRLRPWYIFLLVFVLCIGVAATILVVTNSAAAFISADIFQQKPQVLVNLAVPIDTLTSTQTTPPTLTFTPTLPPTATFTPTITSTFTATPTETPTLTPTGTPTEAASPTPLPTDTAEPIPTRSVPTAPSGVSGGVHWIDVDLTNQMVYAYEGKTIVNSFLVSTGVSPHRTITGSFHIYEKHISANMWGPGYFLPDVPYTMYFQKGYALHGTYWHSNFGTPMSHGCVNLYTPDAEWLYYWATIGTLVRVHY